MSLRSTIMAVLISVIVTGLIGYAAIVRMQTIGSIEINKLLEENNKIKQDYLELLEENNKIKEDYLDTLEENSVIEEELTELKETINNLQEESTRFRSAGASNNKLSIEDCLIIGDSNTVRMYRYGTRLSDAKYVAAIVSASANNWKTHTNSSNTTNNLSIKQYLDSLSSDAFDNVVIILGTNDYSSTEEKFKGSYRSLIDYIYSRNGYSNIILVTVPPVLDSVSPSIKNSDTKEISSYIREIGSELGLYVIELNDSLSPNDMSTGDGYHYSTSGAIKAADYICNIYPQIF